MRSPDKNTAEYLEWARLNLSQDQISDWSAWILGDSSRKSSESQFEWPNWPIALNQLENISARNLKILGDVAAESDAVLEYFLITETTKSIEKGNTVLILGRKGTGKTALVRYFTEDEKRKETARAISLDGYPWKIHEQRVDASASEVEAYIASWRYLMAIQFAILLTNHSKVDDQTNEFKSIKIFLESNYGSINPDIGDILLPDRLEISKTTLEPQVLGNKLGGISFERTNRNAGRELSALTDTLLQSISKLASACGIEDLSLHFDELDRGLTTFEDSRKNMLIGLVSAALAVSRESSKWPVRCRPIVYLRTDLWEALRFSDKTKVTYGKTTVLEWDSDSLMKLVEARIRKQLNEKASWKSITSPSLMRGSQSKWDHILTRTFMRPRDVIQFLNCALTVVHKREPELGLPLIIKSKDITDARVDYSTYLKRELDDEVGSHWSNWDDALKACSSISTVTFQYDQFIEKYESRKSKTNDLGADAALSMLYQYSVIGYEGRSGYGGSSWIFHYLNPQAGWDSNSTRFKVHAGLKEFAKLREERTGPSQVDHEDE